MKSLVKKTSFVRGLIELHEFLRKEVDLTIDLIHGPRMVFIDIVVRFVTYIFKALPGLPRIRHRIRIWVTAIIIRITRLGRRRWCGRSRRSRRDGVRRRII